MNSTIRPIACLWVTMLAAACNGSGGGGGETQSPTGPQFPAVVPNGAGNLSITMAGTWTIQDAAVIETNAATPAPPLNGTPFVLDAQRILTIGGLSVAPDDLALFLGAQLVSYVNMTDGRTLFYGVTVDRRPAGGTREEIALAGGAIDADTIAVEAFSSTQSPSQVEPEFVRSRYTLVRVPSPATVVPVGIEPLEAAFGAR
ncbi:MAG TPA: hypothetical protein ENI87_09185 [bacterium]|nr:hypothetical protein [bacterium]